RDMPLRDLQLAFTDVRDLAPLRGAPLEILNLSETPVADLEPLRGMPLKRIVLDGCRNLTDLTPLCDCRELETIVLPPQPGNLNCLRKLPKLTRIGWRPVRMTVPVRGPKP